MTKQRRRSSCPATVTKERNKGMPVIRVELLEGRTREQKRDFAREVTESFVRCCGGTPQSIHVVFQDVSRDDWALAGKLMSDAPPAPPVKPAG